MIKERYFLLYATCVPVGGYIQTAIYDIQNHTAKAIPNELFALVTEAKNCSVGYLKTKYKEDDIIDELFDYLAGENMGFYTKHPGLFPEMDLTWEVPYLITNIIMDIGPETIIPEKIFDEIEQSGCQAMQIRYMYAPDIADLKSFMEKIHTSRLRSIELFIQYDDRYTKSNYNEILNLDGRIRVLYVYSSPVYKECDLINEKNAYGYMVKQDISDSKLCGNINSSAFMVNLSLLTESQYHNTCLNRKVYIDSKGNIKNCPAMEHDFGNIKDILLKDAIEKPGFKKLWDINKDRIDVCKDCEYRYMCTDCRCFIKDPENIYSQPAKCTYNPYIAKWEGEEAYVPVEECGTYSKETGFVPDDEKITMLNNI